MFVIDCGVNKSRIYDTDTEKLEVLSHEEILELPGKLPPGSKLVAERAHLGIPRQHLSRAQPFTDRQLFKFYDECEAHNIELRLFPEQSTPRACALAKLAKSDDTDPIAIGKFLLRYPYLPLMRPPTTFTISDIRLESYEFKAETNQILNIARRYEYMDENDENTRLIKDNIERIASELSDNAKELFGLTDKARYKKKDKNRAINTNSINMTQIYSVLSTLQTIDGKPRIRPSTHNLGGWRWMKRYILCSSPHHLKGGVLRSNIYYHGARNYIAKKCGEELGILPRAFLKKRRNGYWKEDEVVNFMLPHEENVYLKYRSIFMSNVKEMYFALKSIVEEKNSIDYSGMFKLSQD